MRDCGIQLVLSRKQRHKNPVLCFLPLNYFPPTWYLSKWSKKRGTVATKRDIFSYVFEPMWIKYEMMHSCIMCLFLSSSLLLSHNGVDESSCILYGTRKQNGCHTFICYEQTENRSLWMTNIFKYKLTYSYSHSVVRHDCARRWFPGQRQDKAQMEKLVAG